MLLFSKKIEPDAPFVKNETVVNLADLPGVPMGTKGKVKLANGISWQRYWVFFDNGVELGQVDADLLARPHHQDILSQRLEDLEEQKIANRKRAAEEQKELMELLLNPPPEPEKLEEKETTEGPNNNDTSTNNGADVNNDATEAEKSSDAENSTENTANQNTAEISSSEAQTTAAPSPELESSAGSALVDVPEHLLQRSAEQRTRLEQ